MGKTLGGKRFIASFELTRRSDLRDELTDAPQRGCHAVNKVYFIGLANRPACSRHNGNKQKNRTVASPVFCVMKQIQ
jgi:hypothetical protein